MKRLLLVLRGDDPVFALADHDWADLHERLRKEAAKPGERREDLGEILDWAEANKLREHRHNAVHGAWWAFSGCGARVSRWPRRTGGRIIWAELSDYERIAGQCWELVERLDQLLGEDWPRAMLLA